MGQGIDVRERLRNLGDELRESFVSKRRVMSFAEYLELVAENPTAQLRSAPQFIRDCFEHFGTRAVKYPWGQVRRFNLFDCPWSGGRDRLVGQEEIQNEIYRVLVNFVSEGAANKLILLHGPNGSAKSTTIRCIGRAMQAYSQLDEGALYRFNWIFPAQKVSRAGIGFAGGEYADVDVGESLAHLPDDLIDAKMCDELRDHPLLLIPAELRRQMMVEWLGTKGDAAFQVSDYLAHGNLSHRNKVIFEALLANYHGDYLKVLRHVQVERFFISHRYREAYVTVEPQMSVDAMERQITADRSIAALPHALQSLTLYNYSGELVAGNRGLIEFSDLLKRPLEAYKYLLTTVEQSSVSLTNAALFLDLCFIGTSNEVHLSAFKEIPEFQSFRGRLELVRVPYLLDLFEEEKIYQAKLDESARTRHVAPHCAYVAALWAILTRMRKPMPDKYPKSVTEFVSRLTPLEKAELYGNGTTPEGLGSDEAKDLLAQIKELRLESESYPNYEGRTGASPREMQTVIFNAVSSSRYSYVSPLAVLDEIEALCKHTSVYAFLKQEPLPGGYHDHRKFIEQVKGRLLDRVDDEVRASMGLVEDVEYQKLFDKYVTHVMHWTKNEKIRNSTTGKPEDPDEKMMREVESTLGVTSEHADFRNNLIAKIGAWSLDHPKEKPVFEGIFADYFRKLKASYYQKRKKSVRSGVEWFLKLVMDSEKELRPEEAVQAKTMLKNLTERFGYNKDSARDIVRLLVRERYSR